MSMEDKATSTCKLIKIVNKINIAIITLAVFENSLTKVI